MRYQIAEDPYILCKFDSGDTVTIALYDLSDDSSEGLDSASMSEIGSTGVFKWSTSNITTTPSSRTEYLWIANNGTEYQYGKIVLGGYPENVDQALSTMEDNIRGADDDDLKDISDEIAALNDLSAAEVNAEVDTALADYDPPTKAEMDAGFSAVDADLTTIEGKIDTVDTVVDGLDTNIDFLLKVVKNKKILEKTGSTWYLIIYDDDSSTEILNKAVKDADGNEISDITAGLLAQEIKTSV